MQDFNVFLKEKVKEIKSASSQQDIDMFELIGSVRDVFSSAYLTESIADSEIIKELWGVLLAVFVHSKNYDNKFESIVAMNDIYLHAKRQHISLCLSELKRWRKKMKVGNISSEILECVDDILIG